GQNASLKSTTFNVVTFGSQNSRTITETDPAPAYALTGLQCTEDGTQNSTTSPGTRTATVIAEEGETISCTFTNTQQPGTLIVKKTVVNNSGGTKNAGDFSFSLDSGAATPFNPAGDGDGNPLTGQNTLIVSPGPHSLAETVVA